VKLGAAKNEKPPISGGFFVAEDSGADAILGMVLGVT